MPGVNNKLIEDATYRLLRRGLQVRLTEIKAAIPLIATQNQHDSHDRELEELQNKRRRILENYEDGAYGDGATAKAERDSKLAPVLKRIRELESEGKPAHQSDEGELERAIGFIRNNWDEIPNPIRREILRAYVPNGFRFINEKTIEAEVCGVLLQADIQRDRLQPGRPKRKDGIPIAKDSVSSSDSPVNGGISRSGGIAAQEFPSTTEPTETHRVLWYRIPLLPVKKPTPV